ncbi:MAG: hypothetical protein ACOCXA_05560 [Planctomycetota bacterium]
MRFCALLLCCLMGSAPLFATQLQERELLSPIVNRPFTVKTIPFSALTFRHDSVAQPADMKTDDDGCRHNSGLSEYDYYVATDPYSYFTAATVEWDDKTPRFRNRLEDSFKRWVRDELHSEWIIERNQIYKREREFARRQGKEMPPRDEWVIPQSALPIERRYKLALRCYRERNARPAFMAKLALMGSWALRVALNRPIIESDLSAGVGEVNDRVQRQAPTDRAYNADTINEDFDPELWLRIYKRVFESGNLSPEGAWVAGSTYFGLVLRQGDVDEAQRVLDRLAERFKRVDGQLGTKLRALIKDRRLTLKDYLEFTRNAVGLFIQAIQNEEIARTQLPPHVMVVAEGLRRSGRYQEAYDWYLTLARMDETQKALRDQIRGEGGVPDLRAGSLVQLGWLADSYLEYLSREKGIREAKTPQGPHAGICNAILHGGLGTADFDNPAWRPSSDAGVVDAQAQLDRIGKTLMEQHMRQGSWPERLADLWLVGIIPDWNAVNRFHCLATGEPYAYRPPESEPGRRIVLVAMSAPVRTAQGLRYGAYLMDNSLVWTAEPPTPGEPPPRADDGL